MKQVREVHGKCSNVRRKRGFSKKGGKGGGKGKGKGRRPGKKGKGKAALGIGKNSFLGGKYKPRNTWNVL